MLVLLNGEIPVVQEFPQTSRTVELLFSSHIVQLSFFFFNLYFCFMLIGITCWDHILDSLIFCLFGLPLHVSKEAFSSHIVLILLCCKKRKKENFKKKKKKGPWNGKFPMGRSLWKTRMANAELAASRNPQPPPSLNGSSISSQGGGVLCVCKAMYSVPSLLL